MYMLVSNILFAVAWRKSVQERFGRSRAPSATLAGVPLPLNPSVIGQERVPDFMQRLQILVPIPVDAVNRPT
ncbi:hypothetical protein D9M68_586260 [compost metagenome]